MTTHDDRTDLETRLRASLRDRAEDVEVTPALYERVRRQASRGAWLRRGLALAGAAAVVVAAVTVIPPLLGDPTPIDIADTPEDAAPSVPPSEPSPEPSPGTVFPDPLLEADLAFADSQDRITVRDRTAVTPATVVSLAVSPFWDETDGLVAAGLEDGRIGLVQQSTAGGFDLHLLVDAAANGGGVGFSPDGQAVAWIEGTDLHVLPLASAPEGERVLPLVGDVPDDLVLEQWFGAADSQLVLASDPAGGVWRIPMDDSDVFNTGPTDPASLLPAAADTDVVDAALLSDLSPVVLRVPTDGVATLTVGGDAFPVEDVSSRDVELTVTGGDATVFDPTTGVGSRRSIEVDSFDAVASWETPGITAVAPLPSTADSTGSTADDAAALGLPTDAAVIGTSGTDLLVRTPDDAVERIAVYPAESEATLGRLAVRPGSSPEQGMVAVELFSEGEHSVRFLELRDGAASPVGDVLVVDGPLTGLIWSEDGGEIAFTDTMALHYARVDLDGTVAGGGEVLSRDARPVLDWTWTEVADNATGGVVTVAVNGGTGVEFLRVGRDADGLVRLLEPVGGADRVVLDLHTSPNAAVGPQVTAELGGGTAVLRWSADGDRSGALADPGIVGGDVRVEASGGHVLVMGDSRQVLVTFDGEVVDLPAAADWDVLD